MFVWKSVLINPWRRPEYSTLSLGKYKRSDEFRFFRRTELMSTTPEKELYPNGLVYTVCLITAVGRGRVFLYFIKCGTKLYIDMYYKHDDDRNVPKHVAIVQRKNYVNLCNKVNIITSIKYVLWHTINWQHISIAFNIIMTVA